MSNADFAKMSSCWAAASTAFSTAIMRARHYAARAVHTLHVWIATELTAVEGLAAVFSSKIALTLVGLRTNRANTLPSLTAMLDKYRYDCSQQREHRTPLIADFSRQYQLTVERCFDASSTA
jgi:hypothetical protein